MPVTRGNSKRDAFYAVARGRRIGIYGSWSEAETLVKGFAGAKYKKFSSLREAQSFLGKGYENETVSVVSPASETNDDADIQRRARAVHSAPIGGGGESLQIDFIDLSSSPSSASPSPSIREKQRNAPNPDQADDEKNNSVCLALMPEELRGKSLQFFHDHCLLLCMTNGNLYQVHSYSHPKEHSWFTSDYIFSGNCNYISKVDPILVCLRHFYHHSLQRAATISQIFCNNVSLDCPLTRSIDWSIICDIESPRENDDQVRYRFNADRSLDYLQVKVNKVTSLIKSGKIGGMKNSASDCHVALELLFPFLPDALYTRLVHRVTK